MAGGTEDAWSAKVVSLSTDTWYHLLTTYSTIENSKRVYLDGSLLNQTGLGPKNPSNNSPLIFGSEENRAFLDGKLDDIRIYDRALSAFEVKSLYELGDKQDGNACAGTPLVQAEVADGSVTASKIASNAITTNELSEQILK